MNSARPVPDRLAKMMAYLPSGRRRKQVSARDLTSELKQEIVDYFKVFEWSGEVERLFGLSRVTLMDVSLLDAVRSYHDLARAAGLVHGTHYKVTSPESVSRLAALLPVDYRKRRHFNINNSFPELRAAIFHDFMALESSKLVARRYNIGYIQVHGVVLFLLHSNVEIVKQARREVRLSSIINSNLSAFVKRNVGSVQHSNQKPGR